MKVAILFALVAVAIAAPAQEPVAILSQTGEVDPDGKFHYSYQTADGVTAEQHGELKVLDKDHAGVVAAGSYAYTGDDGVVYKLSYTADEFGFHPEGAHLPVAPPVPETIARAIAFITSQPVQQKKF